MERTEFLGKVAASLSAEKVPRVEEAPELPAADMTGIVDEFVTAAEDVGAIVHRVLGAAAVREKVLEIARSVDAASFLAWDEAHLGVLGVAPFLEVAGLALVENSQPGPDRDARMTQVAAADLGVTGSIGGFADSGTFVLHHGAGRARAASLLPPTHIALVRADQLEASIVSFCANNPEALETSSNLVFVTGPSRTGDIEMILTTGVHGPKQVHIVLVD